MPRLQPPVGYIAGQEARDRLNISDTLLRKYVDKGYLKKYGPAGHTHRPWYRETEVEALYHMLHVLEESPMRSNEVPRTSFEIASEEDMKTVFDIDTRTFQEPAASFAVCMSWLRKNPHTYYVLKDDQGVVKAYASLVPMDKRLIDKFVHEELHGEDITADMIDVYEPGRPLHLYVMAIAVDPTITGAARKVYGSRIVLGLFRFLLGLADRGIDIRTITARNYMQKEEGGLRLPEGYRLLKDIGLTQLREITPGVNLFFVSVPESGVSILAKYTDRLNAWKAEHLQQEEKSA